MTTVKLFSKKFYICNFETMEIKGNYFYLQSYYPSRTNDYGTQNEEILECTRRIS